MIGGCVVSSVLLAWYMWKKKKPLFDKIPKAKVGGGVRVLSSSYQSTQLPSPQAQQLDEDNVLDSDLGVECSGADLGVDSCGAIVVDYLSLDLNDMILYSDEESSPPSPEESSPPSPQLPSPKPAPKLRAPKPQMNMYPAHRKHERVREVY